jgi:CheY-like chemotaxis protein
MRILILDDQPGLAEMLAVSLRPYGHFVKSFTSPREALASIGDMDILVVDHHMPEMNGLEVARRAYDQGWRGSLLLMSGNPGAIKEAVEHPLLRLVLDKPFQTQTLADAVTDLGERK